MSFELELRPPLAAVFFVGSMCAAIGSIVGVAIGSEAASLVGAGGAIGLVAQGYRHVRPASQARPSTPSAV